MGKLKGNQNTPMTVTTGQITQLIADVVNAVHQGKQVLGAAFDPPNRMKLITNEDMIERVKRLINTMPEDLKDNLSKEMLDKIPEVLKSLDNAMEDCETCSDTECEDHPDNVVKHDGVGFIDIKNQRPS